MKLSQALKRTLPLAYFIALWVFIGLSNDNYLAFLIGAPFVYAIFDQRKPVTLLLGILSLLWAGWISLAFVTDLLKLHMIDLKELKFLIGGSIFVTLNFWMGILLLKNSVVNNTSHVNHSVI